VAHVLTNPIPRVPRFRVPQRIDTRLQQSDGGRQIIADDERPHLLTDRATVLHERHDEHR
jgi:hypothetical protein